MEDEILQPDESQEEAPVQEETSTWQPRPAYQVWAARIGLVIMIISIILYYWHIATGGRI